MFRSMIAALFIFAVMLTSTARAAEFEMISYSAQVKLQWLAAAGIPDAQLFKKLLGKPDFFNKDNLRDFERLEKVNAVYNEFCYASFIDYVRAHDYKNIYEIGCSYSPRVVALVKDGRKYAGVELAAVAMIADDLAERVLGKKYRGQFEYFDAPVTDAAAMFDAAGLMDGEICVIEQGLMIYFNREQIAEMLINVKNILKAHGGCFVTSNFSRKPYFAQIVEPLYGKDAVEPLYRRTRMLYEDVLGDPMYDDTFSSDEDAIKFLNNLGFNVKRAPLFTSEPTLYSFKGLTVEQTNALKNLAKQDYIWVLTLK